MAQTSTTAGGNSLAVNNKILFWASFLTLIAAGMGFSLRNTAVKAQWGSQFGFTQTELGDISGGGLAGFGITIIVLSFVADKIGYGRLMGLAFFFHFSSAVVTLCATFAFKEFGRDGAYWCLTIGMWLFAFGNGTCEAVINPLTATLYPNEKTKWLNILHAGWPLGLVLGSLVNIVLDKTAGASLRWEIRLSIFVVPVLIYGLMMFRRPFPRSEANASGISLGVMMLQLLSPILLFLIFIHAMVGYVELGTDSWITSVTGTILKDQTYGTLLFIWTSMLMFTLRFFAGPIAHKISPLGLLLFSAILGAAGLTLLGNSTTLITCILAATVYGLGKTFLWPTMLGVVSERYPKGGALTLGMVGGVGMLSAGLLGDPGIGYEQDYFARSQLLDTSPDAYARYKSDTEKGFPFVTPLVKEVTGQDRVPKIAGLDNFKVGLLEEYAGMEDKTKPTSVENEIELLKAANRDHSKLDKQLDWWNTVGKEHATADEPKIKDARLHGAEEALKITAAVPATMGICYLLLIIYFRLTGGYRQEHISPQHGGHG